MENSKKKVTEKKVIIKGEYSYLDIFGEGNTVKKRTLKTTELKPNEMQALTRLTKKIVSLKNTKEIDELNKSLIKAGLKKLGEITPYQLKNRSNAARIVIGNVSGLNCWEAIKTFELFRDNKPEEAIRLLSPAKK